MRRSYRDWLQIRNTFNKSSICSKPRSKADRLLPLIPQFITAAPGGFVLVGEASLEKAGEVPLGRKAVLCWLLLVVSDG